MSTPTHPSRLFIDILLFLYRYSYVFISCLPADSANKTGVRHISLCCGIFIIGCQCLHITSALMLLKEDFSVVDSPYL
jgi:hypothetical protein